MDRETKIQKALSDLRAAFAEPLRRLEHDVAAEAKRVSEEIEKRKEFARSIDLTARIFSIYDHVNSNYPDCVLQTVFTTRVALRIYDNVNSHYPDRVCPSISNVTELEKFYNRESGEKQSVAFDFRGKRWFLTFEAHWREAVDHSYAATLGLLDSAKNLLLRFGMSEDERTSKLRLVHYGTSEEWYYSQFQHSDIQAFAPGEWIVEFLELSEEIAALDRERALKNERTKLEEQRKQFALHTDDNNVEKIIRKIRGQVKYRRQEFGATHFARYVLWIKNKLNIG